MRVAFLQINPTAGDIPGNSGLIVAAARRARQMGADLAVTPELALMGYLPRDLLMSHGFVRRARQEAGRHGRRTCATARRCWWVWPRPIPRDIGRPLFNSAVLLRDGARAARRFHKTLLPTYDVFDEDRYFEPAAGAADPRTGRLAPGHQHLRRRLERPRFLAAPPLSSGPHRSAGRARRGGHCQSFGVAIHRREADLREQMLGHMARKYGLPLVIVNQVGGNDDLIFDGRSAAFDPQGPLFARARGFEEDVLVVDLASVPAAPSPRTISTPEAEIWRALVLGVRDYARKTRLPQVLLGLSGGIDSALTAAIAAEAMGAGERARRDDALGLFQRRQRGRFRGTGPQPGHPHPHAPHRRHYARLRGRSGGCVPRPAPPTSPKKISSRAFAATC